MVWESSLSRIDSLDLRRLQWQALPTMHEFYTLFVVLIQGGIIGFLAYDLAQRKAFNLAISEKESELKAAAKALADLHNSAMKANEDLQNKVQSMELAVKSTTNVNVMKRFQ